jgi:hypothetical protein
VVIFHFEGSTETASGFDLSSPPTAKQKEFVMHEIETSAPPPPNCEPSFSCRTDFEVHDAGVPETRIGCLRSSPIAVHVEAAKHETDRNDPRSPKLEPSTNWWMSVPDQVDGLPDITIG